MGIVLLGDLDIANGEEVELLELAAAGAVDGQEDGPDGAAAGDADDGEDLEEAEEEVAVEGAVVEDVVVLDGEEGLDPVEPAAGEDGTGASAVRSRRGSDGAWRSGSVGGRQLGMGA